MAAIGSIPFERGDEAEGFLIVTAAADQGLVDIHDRRPLVLSPEAVCQQTSSPGTLCRARWVMSKTRARS